MRALVVARGADLIALIDGCLVVLRERDHPADALTAALFHVVFARTVAAFAARALLGAARMLQHEPPHLRRGEPVPLVLVTSLARLRPDVAGVSGQRRGGGRGGGRRGRPGGGRGP